MSKPSNGTTRDTPRFAGISGYSGFNSSAPSHNARSLAVIGGGWAGLAAAIHATQAGFRVKLFESSRFLGGRARVMPYTHDDGTTHMLDNGQHILIGAYTQTLALMRTLGVNPNEALLRLPLSLRFPDGTGLQCPAWPAPFDALAGMLTARGWTWGDKFRLLRACLRWQRQGFQCPPLQTVAQLCTDLTPRLMAELIEPLCASALNTAAEQASAQVFLRVLQDSLFGGLRGSNLLIPRQDLGQLLPDPAATWLRNHGVQIHMGCRVQTLAALDASQANGWQMTWQHQGNHFGQAFDQVILACPSWEAARLARVAASQEPAGPTGGTSAELNRWSDTAEALNFEAITTVYARTATRLPAPILALRSSPEAPAQFVFDRRHLGDAHQVLAFVVSVSQGEREQIEQQVIAQGRAQLGLADLQVLQTVVEKRATFACTPSLLRPSTHIAPGLLACGEYVAGPYPGTLEGAIRSAQAAVEQLGPSQLPAAHA